MTTVRLNSRKVLQLSGSQSRTWLQGLVTNDVLAVANDRSIYAGMLSAQGKLVADLIIFDTGSGDDSLYLDVDASLADSLTRRLTMYRLRADVAVAQRNDLAVCCAWGTEAVSNRPADPRLEALGQRWIAPVSDAPEADDAAALAHRWTHGVAEGVLEMGSEQLLWLETNAEALNGVSYTKGCYVGQENTARMHHRAKVRKRLLVLTGCPAETADATVRCDDKLAGEIMRAEPGMNPNGQAFALLRTEYLDKPLTVGGHPVNVRLPSWLGAELESTLPKA